MQGYKLDDAQVARLTNFVLKKSFPWLRGDDWFRNHLQQKLYEVAQRWKPERGKFDTFAQRCLRNHGIDLLRLEKAGIRIRRGRVEYTLAQATKTEQRGALPIDAPMVRIDFPCDDAAVQRFIEEQSLGHAKWRPERVVISEYDPTTESVRQTWRRGFIIEADDPELPSKVPRIELYTSTPHIDGVGRITAADWRRGLGPKVAPIFDVLAAMGELDRDPPYGTWQKVALRLGKPGKANTLSRVWHRAVDAYRLKLAEKKKKSHIRRKPTVDMELADAV